MAKVVVTGSNRGIGLEMCRQLSARGDKVLATCRVASEGLRALDVELFEGFDVTDDTSLSRLRDHLASDSVDLLINNAGILRRETLTDLNIDSIREQSQ